MPLPQDYMTDGEKHDHFADPEADSQERRLMAVVDDAWRLSRFTKDNEWPAEGTPKFLEFTDLCHRLECSLRAAGCDPCRNRVETIDPDNIERTESGEIVYVHSDECGGFCDYSCNNPEGDRLAAEQARLTREIGELHHDFLGKALEEARAEAERWRDAYDKKRWEGPAGNHQLPWEKKKPTDPGTKKSS